MDMELDLIYAGNHLFGPMILDQVFHAVPKCQII